MSGHGVPSNYAGATRLDADANACLSLSRAIWLSLSRAQRLAISGSESIVGSFWTRASTGRPTQRVLITRGLADASTASDSNGRAALTGLGVMVREAGIYTREHPVSGVDP